MLVVGITGTLGAGKGTVVDFLIKNYGFLHFSVRNFLIEEIKNRNLEINRDNMVAVANDLRSQFGSDYIVSKLYDKAIVSGHNVIIESIRTIGEVQSLKSKGQFILLAVDADQKMRYDRIVLRANETDHVSFEKFVADEQREMNNTDINKGNLSACIDQADYKIINNGTQQELFDQIKNFFGHINTLSHRNLEIPTQQAG